MTLYIEVKGVERCLKGKGIIYVDNGQAGSLVSPKFTSKTDDFKKPFMIMCSSQDRLTFKICEEHKNKKQQTIVGIAQFVVPVYIKNYEQHLLQNDNQVQYEIDAYTPDEKFAGTIKMKVRYDKSSLFMGEIALEKKQQKALKNLQFYKGPCPSKNFFNCMDREVKDQKFKFVESIYGDEEVDTI